MITFYPGPSKLYPQVEGFLSDAFRSGLLSMNHRSKPFMEMLSQAISLLKEKLDVPDAYQVVFTSSATECWEIVAQSLTEGTSYHIFNGAFGSKWADYAHRIHGRSTRIAYGIEEQPQLVPAEYTERDVLCVTHTETSNGTVVSNQSLTRLREQFPGTIAIDATSSMAGTSLQWEQGDLWYASVQKCFGLPSGLAVMILSPKAVQRAKELKEDAHYNSLGFVVGNFEKFQTPYTPNILGIYLVKRLMETLAPINSVSEELEKRAKSLYSYLENAGFTPLIGASGCRSSTVVTIQAPEEEVKALKAYTAENGIVVGNGYGDWKETTFRIANFPAITESELTVLKTCISRFKNN
jgi:phosphoserine aminotransferase